MNRPLKIIHVVRAFKTGGLETLVLEMCARMASMDGLHVLAVGMLPGDGLESRETYDSFDRVTLNGVAGRSRFRLVDALYRLFRREQPDVVHVHNFLAQVYAGAAARATGTPALVGTKHGADWPSLLSSRRLASYVYRLCDRLVAVSDDVRRGLLRAYGFAHYHVSLILNGIDTERFRPTEDGTAALRQEALGLTGAPVIGTVCRLAEYKGVRTLLDGFNAVLSECPGACLVLVGDGPDRSLFEIRTRELGLDGSVTFLGNCDDVAAIYPAFDIYAQPSYTEGISLTMLEASSCALPVVATRVGGTPEIVVDGETGLLVPPRDADALAQAILWIWRNRNRAHAMGRAARQRVKKKFSLDRMVRDYLELYQELYHLKTGRAACTEPRRRLT